MLSYEKNMAQTPQRTGFNFFHSNSLSWCFGKEENFIGNFEMNTWGWIKVKTALGGMEMK